MSAALDAANHVRRQRATIRHEIREHGRREAWRIIRDLATNKPPELDHMPVCDLLAMNMWAPLSRIQDIAAAAGVTDTTVGDLTQPQLENLVWHIGIEIARKSPLDMED